MKPYESYDWSSRQSLAAVRTSSNSPAGSRKNVGGKHNRVERQTPVSNTGTRINNGKEIQTYLYPSKLHDSFCLVIHVF
jgi:hypothetical protein